MITEFCVPAHYDAIGAIYIRDLLLIWAKVTVGNRYYHLRIRPSPFRIYPPMYDLLVCTKGYVPMIYDPVQIPIFERFYRPGLQEDYVPINTATGRVEVPVFVVSDIPFDPSKTLHLANETDGMPSPWTASGFFASPIGLQKVFETEDSSKVQLPQNETELHVVRATGYSYALSFDEAFQNAVSNLPVNEVVFDWLDHVQVDSIGGDFGGIAGIRRLHVTISTIRWGNKEAK